jgi:CubicO group peptidase (beta-lactamase class C family)
MTRILIAGSARTLPDAPGRNKRVVDHVDMGREVARRHTASVMAALIASTIFPLAPAAAQRSEAPAAFGAALETWAAKHRITRAFIIVRRDGRVVHASALGGADPGAPVHLASLSKAITAACVATLIRDGKLAFDTPVAAALAKFIAVHGKPRDPRLLRVTIGQLLTHRAGFANSDDDDPATGRNLDRYLKTGTARAPPKASLVAATLRARLVREPGAGYAYGNAAYLLLGAVIEEASGELYLSYCRKAVLEPLGVTGDFEPAWRVSSSMGAWRMRAADYLRFLDVFAVDDPRLGDAAKAWMLEPQGKTVPFDRAAWYGFGTFVHKAERGADIWHWGSWDYTPESWEKDTVRTSFVAYVKRMSDGTAWFVYAQPRVEEGVPRIELDRALFEAYRATKR